MFITDRDGYGQPSIVRDKLEVSARNAWIAISAIEVARAGLAVFPCAADKRPVTSRGFKDATRNPARIRALFERPAAKLIGVPTGRLTGTVALDIDVKPDRDGRGWLDAHDLPRTRTHATPSGGMHLILRYPDGTDLRNSASKLAPGVDVRAEGGYVCWPDVGGYRVVDGAPRADLPGWLLEMLARPSPTRERPPPGPPLTTDQFGRYQGFVLRLLGNVARAPEGGKHDTLLRNGRALGGVVGAMGMAPARAVQLLIDALPPTVMDWINAGRTAEWAIGEGMNAPIELADRP